MNPKERVWNFLFPINDNAGHVINTSIYDPILREIAHNFGGFTVVGNVKGCWTNETRKGYIQDDRRVYECDNHKMIVIGRDFDNERYAGMSREAMEAILEADDRFLLAQAKLVGDLTGQAAIFSHHSPAEVNLTEGYYRQSLPEADLTGRRVQKRLTIDEVMSTEEI